MKNVITRSLAGLLLGSLCSIALAVAVITTVSWTIPNKRTDGTALAPTEIASYVIYYRVDGGAESSVTVTPGSATVREITLNLAPRAAKYVATFDMIAIDTGGKKSNRSAAVSLDIPVDVAAPNPPTSILVRCVGATCTAAFVQ